MVAVLVEEVVTSGHQWIEVEEEVGGGRVVVVVVVAWWWWW